MCGTVCTSARLHLEKHPDSGGISWVLMFDEDGAAEFWEDCQGVDPITGVWRLSRSFGMLLDFLVEHLYPGYDADLDVEIS